MTIDGSINSPVKRINTFKYVKLSTENVVIADE